MTGAELYPLSTEACAIARQPPRCPEDSRMAPKRCARSGYPTRDGEWDQQARYGCPLDHMVGRGDSLLAADPFA